MKNILLIILAILGSLNCIGQSVRQMVIYRKGMEPFIIRMAEVDSIAVVDSVGDPYRAVDLGLSVKWAACNVGATKPEECGDYFAWGETATKETFTSENYVPQMNGTVNMMKTDIAGTEYDAAHAVWGLEWRMPTLAEVDELSTRCTWEATTVNGVKGLCITGPTGNSIFLPAAGQKRETVIELGTMGYYWTSTPSLEYSTAAMNLNFAGYDNHWSANRAYGFSIRAVKE